MPKSGSKTVQGLAALALLSSISLTAMATQTPVFQTFGPLAVATFGGSGIPNNAVAQTKFDRGGILGLTATARFGNPTVTNNGAGRFFAPAGVDQTDPSSIAQLFARWNIDFYVDNGNQTGNLYQLFMDVDPTAGESFKSFGAGAVVNVSQDSLNLGRNASEVALLYTFNPTIPGEYTFLLTASRASAELARTSIVVQVVPEPSSLALMALGLLGLAGLRRKNS